MNDTDRQIVNSLHNVDIDCCQSCVNGCNADSPDQQICTLFGQHSPVGDAARLVTLNRSVCDLWEKAK